eukprot:2982117-Pyramimonas_sp.AAC.1
MTCRQRRLHECITTTIEFSPTDKKPIDLMHCMTHSPKHPDCEIYSRTMAQNAPCRRQRKPHPPADPADEDNACEAF